jgi:hypothetical protein
LAATLALACFPSLAAAAPCGTENLLAGKKPSASQAIKGDIGQVTDGTVSPEGAQWDSSTTVTLEGTTSSITYDLGEVREISAIVAQADANDTYKVMGSVDGSPASFKLITELANVVNTGHGLRTRAVQVPGTTARFVRIGDANGDNYFTIAEFAVYCKAPTPFPPGMKIVDAPPVATPDAQTTPKPGSDTGRWALLLTAVALALAWLAYKTITRPAAGSGGTAEAKPEDKPADKPPTDDKPAT